MSYYSSPSKPGVLSVITVVSFCLSILNVIWFLIITLAAVGVSVFSWLGGPAVGATMTIVAGVLWLVTFARVCLSVLLLAAAWHTWQGTPQGRSLHLAWA